MKTFYLISYDISDNKRRTKIMHLLEGYGERVQYSVFEVWLDERQLEQVRKQLERLLKPRATKATAKQATPPADVEDGRPAADTEDEKPAPVGSVRIYALCGMCQERREVLGLGHPTEIADVYVV